MGVSILQKYLTIIALNMVLDTKSLFHTPRQMGLRKRNRTTAKRITSMLSLAKLRT